MVQNDSVPWIQIFKREVVLYAVSVALKKADLVWRMFPVCEACFPEKVGFLQSTCGENELIWCVVCPIDMCVLLACVVGPMPN